MLIQHQLQDSAESLGSPTRATPLHWRPSAPQCRRRHHQTGVGALEPGLGETMTHDVVCGTCNTCRLRWGQEGTPIHC